MRTLALDVGERRIGVAISDERGWLASPTAVILRRSKAEDCARLTGMIRERGVEALVVGHPLNDDGTAGPQAQRIERYAAALVEALRAAGLDLPLRLWDESFSTRSAEEMMIAGGRKARDRRARIDAAAAAVILQEYLDAARQGEEGVL